MCGGRYLKIAQELGLKSEEVLIREIAVLNEKLRIPKLSDYIKDTKEIPKLAKLAVLDKCTRINGKKVETEDAESIYKKAF